jgi:hypothetical protein
MNEVVYNILRKIVECPERLSVSTTSCNTFSFKRLYLDDKQQLLLIIHNKKAGKYRCNEVESLTHKECLRIVKAFDHITAMNIRRV